MSIYITIYYNMCERGKTLKECYVPYSGLHKHHIIPKHSGGSDHEDNYTYLTVREHIIAHFLLWKLYNNPNDLRSMKMLGANLTPYQRKITGEFCRDNKLGFFSASKNQRTEWGKNGGISCKKQKTGIHNPDNFSKYASIGGKAGAKSQIHSKTGIHNPDNFSKYASIGGKSIKGMICVTNGKHRTRIRPEKLEEFLSMGYKRGFTLFS